MLIVTTTHDIHGKNVTGYLGIVFGEVIVGTNVVKDIKASFTNFFGGRSTAYETDLIAARDEALQEMQRRAAAMGASAVVGVRVDYESIGKGTDSMLMVTASGTAVRIA